MIKVKLGLKMIFNPQWWMCNILLQVFGLGKDEQNSPEIQFASVAQRDTEEKVDVTQTLVRGKPLKHSNIQL